MTYASQLVPSEFKSGPTNVKHTVTGQHDHGLQGNSYLRPRSRTTDSGQCVLLMDRSCTSVTTDGVR